MATVWAYRVGAWRRQSDTGWSHSTEMTGLSSLIETMEDEGLRGVVTHLGIVAHGDQPGVVQLDRVLMPGTISAFTAEFEKLRWYLTRDGMLTFYSCVAGKDEAGSRLLREVSRQLPGRTVVGFELFGLLGPMGLFNKPGMVMGTETSLAQLANDPRSQLGLLHPWCPFAKRAVNGRIVHLPVLEQNARYRKSCANPGCPGHSDPHHSCQGW